MPPRKKPTAPPPQPTRRSKLAKEHSISPSEESQLISAFSLFSSTPHPNSPETISTTDLRRALIALNAPPSSPSELTELIETVDPEESGWISYEHFYAIAALKINQTRDGGGGGSDGGRGAREGEEVRKAFGLFTAGRGGEITVADLRRVARELKEDVPESVLSDMVREAKGGELGGVGVEEFEGVMRRAGVL